VRGRAGADLLPITLLRCPLTFFFLDALVVFSREFIKELLSSTLIGPGAVGH
jgi:hypothetical protein